jgi:MFS transporter, DHA1 family, inner membrane transport protein
MKSVDDDRKESGPASSSLPLRPLMAITAAMVVSMTIEYLPGGLLPLMKSEFNVTYSALGLLITVFAGVVVVTTLPMSWLTKKASRKGLLLTALGCIAISSMLTAAAPEFLWLLAARALGGAAHGLFWSVAAAYVAHLVVREQLARALSLTALGATIATIAGTPTGNLLGQLFGWRAAFGVMAGVTVICLVAVALFLPPVDHHAVEAGTRDQSGATRAGPAGDPTRKRVVPIVLVLAVIITAATSFGTYSVAWLTGPAGFDALAVPVLLLVSALAGAVGLAMNARYADRYPTTALVVTSVGIVISYVTLPAAGGPVQIVLLLVLFGLCWGSVPTLLQAATMRTSSVEGRTFAAALQTTGINVGVGMGALLGGQVILWIGLELLPLVAGLLLLVGGTIAVMLERRLRRHVVGPTMPPRNHR